MQKTLVLLKPDIVRRNLIGQVLAIYEANGLTIEALERVTAKPEQVRQHYIEHVGKPYYEGLIATLADQPLVAVILAGEKAIERVRLINGATDPAQASPDSIRGRFSPSIKENSVHASDSIKSAERELSIWF